MPPPAEYGLSASQLFDCTTAVNPCVLWLASA